MLPIPLKLGMVLSRDSKVHRYERPTSAIWHCSTKRKYPVNRLVIF